MPCLLVLIALAFPRVVLVLLWLFSDYLGRAYHGALLPLLGFFFLPFTTLAYAVAMNEGGGVRGGWILLVVLAVLMDFGVMGGGAAGRRKRLARR
jgi:hypothetical protein